MRIFRQTQKCAGRSARVRRCPIGKVGRCLPDFSGLLQATSVRMTEETCVIGGKLWGIRLSLWDRLFQMAGTVCTKQSAEFSLFSSMRIFSLLYQGG